MNSKDTSNDTRNVCEEYDRVTSEWPASVSSQLWAAQCGEHWIKACVWSNKLIPRHNASLGIVTRAAAAAAVVFEPSKCREWEDLRTERSDRERHVKYEPVTTSLTSWLERLRPVRSWIIVPSIISVSVWCFLWMMWIKVSDNINLHTVKQSV